MLDPSPRCILINHLLNIPSNFMYIQTPCSIQTIKRLDIQDCTLSKNYVSQCVVRFIKGFILTVVLHRLVVKHNYMGTPAIFISTCFLASHYLYLLHIVTYLAPVNERGQQSQYHQLLRRADSH